MVTIKNLFFGYSRKEPLLNDLSLEIDSGHIYSILGSNGTGKSTLLKIICGLLTPQSGSVTTLGMIPDQRRPSMYSELFVIPEEFEMPSLTLRRYVAANAPLYPHFSGEMFDRYAGEFDLSPDTRLDRISMGQKKRALIAFALACRPALLVMDEPTNGLDITAKGVFRRLLASYADEQHTVIISTHQVRDIENLIDHLLILDGKGVVLNAGMEEITRKLYFGWVSEGDSPLYREETLGGTYGVMKNPDGRKSKVSLEQLFNASVKHRDEIFKLFQTENTP